MKKKQETIIPGLDLLGFVKLVFTRMQGFVHRATYIFANFNEIQQPTTLIVMILIASALLLSSVSQ